MTAERSTDLVKVTIDDVTVDVPKNTLLIEAAGKAGVHIPRFCYHPKLSLAGACRICSVSVEKMPKLQTACTTPVADGMIAHTNTPEVAQARSSVLEFLLLNHPLDCPVCDAAGECPLQDYSHLYGPDASRSSIPKRRAPKADRLSPLVVLDMERCILCYRCTRFSEGVSGDMQLVPENRGANSIITTFEGRPYTNEFSGNVTELCPVGALTSSTYRFLARPWEIQNVPTVCGGCAVGCNTYATIREGKVARVLSRNHPDVDEGWLCDKGRYGLGHLRSPERVTQNLIRGGRGLEAVSTADVLDHVADRLRATVERFGPGSVAVLASGEQTNEEAHAWARLLAEALGGGVGVCGPEGGSWWGDLEPYAASISDLAGANAIVVAGDADLGHRAPVLELWIRKAVGKGAGVFTVGPGATRLDTLRGATHVSAAPGTAHTALLEAAGGDGPLADALRGENAVLIWAGPMRAEVASVLAHVAHTSGCRVLRTPRAANEIGIAAAGLGTASPEQALELAESGTIKALVLLGADPVGDWHSGERWRNALARCFFALQVAGFQSDSSGWVTTVVPESQTLEKDGTLVNLEGRVQRLRAAARAPDGVTDGYAWAAELGARLGVELPHDPPAAFADLAERRPAFAGLSWSGIGDRAPLGERTPAGEAPAAAQVAAAAVPQTVVVGYRELMSGAAVDHTEELHFQRRRGVEIAHADAESLGVATGDRIEVTHDGHTVTGPALVQRGLRPGVVRLAARVPHVGPGSVAAAPAEAADA